MRSSGYSGPITHNIEFYRGDDDYVVFEFEDSTGQFTLNGSTIKFTARDYDRNEIFSLSNEDDSIIVTGNTVTVNFKNTLTSSLNPNIKLYYDMQVVNPMNLIKTYVKGSITVYSDITD